MALTKIFSFMREKKKGQLLCKKEFYMYVLSFDRKTVKERFKDHTYKIDKIMYLSLIESP